MLRQILNGTTDGFWDERLQSDFFVVVCLLGCFSVVVVVFHFLTYP